MPTTSMPRRLPGELAGGRRVARDEGFVSWCVELLAPLGAMHAKRMFGGHGLCPDGLFVAIIANEVLYLKAGAETAPGHRGFKHPVQPVPAGQRPVQRPTRPAGNQERGQNHWLHHDGGLEPLTPGYIA
ncbi:TfoX/Sxy family protein [Rehaibacterium terrae]|uniref:TfoX N-terminal domain-containing protein n=1 Tax=Rehaibacterium terrae TaxID=1341696 RepID=A0A7W7XZR0_9GAMM|nr:TfoX/Sxy family protein [Rehaibacterium terrae]MBB5015432.1 hypothetical protein [Rehaibacterium terrae]